MSSSLDSSSPLLTLSDGTATSTERSGKRPALEPCVRGATIAQEREWLQRIRQLALNVDNTTMLSRDLRAVDFAFMYVREDRTKRQAHIRRSKQQSKLRRQLQLQQQQEQQQ